MFPPLLRRNSVVRELVKDWLRRRWLGGLVDQHPAAALDLDLQLVAFEEDPVFVLSSLFRCEFSLTPEFEDDAALVCLENDLRLALVHNPPEVVS